MSFPSKICLDWKSSGGTLICICFLASWSVDSLKKMPRACIILFFFFFLMSSSAAPLRQTRFGQLQPNQAAAAQKERSFTGTPANVEPTQEHPLGTRCQRWSWLLGLPRGRMCCCLLLLLLRQIFFRNHLAHSVSLFLLRVRKISISEWLKKPSLRFLFGSGPHQKKKR